VCVIWVRPVEGGIRSVWGVRGLNVSDMTLQRELRFECVNVVCKKRPGRDVDHPPPSSAEVKKRVELYLYSPLGLRGLF
jgi:hypothetical protein